MIGKTIKISSVKQVYKGAEFLENSIADTGLSLGFSICREDEILTL